MSLTAVTKRTKNPARLHVILAAAIHWLCGASRDDYCSGLDFRLNVGIGVIGRKTFPKSVEETVGTNYFG